MVTIPDRPVIIALGLLTAAVGLSLFVCMGNTHEPETYGPSIVSWTVSQWRNPQGHSGHGMLVPLVSLWLVWRRRREIRQAPHAVAWRALIFVAGALLLYWAGVRAQQPRLGILSMIGLLWSVPFLLWGAAVARLIFFPCLYLVFAVPMGFLAAVTLPLRLVSAAVSVGLLNGMGLAVVRRGTAIFDATAGGFALDVADACSGLRSVIAMTALTAVYAYVTQPALLRRWILFLSAVPLAMAGNVARILTIAVVARLLSEELAMTIYHDYSGYIVFVVAILLMIGLGRLLQRDRSAAQRAAAEP